MIHQLSNKQTILAQVLLVLPGVGLPSFLLTFLVFGADNFNVIVKVSVTILCLLIGLSLLYFSAQLYNVSFNREFIYLNRLGKTKRINIENIEEIKTGFFPLRLFYNNVYIVTLNYFDNSEKHEVRFVSKGSTGFAGTVDHIPLLTTLRQFIKERKYRR